MLPTTVPFALYDGFTDTLFGGSQGGIVMNAGSIDAPTRQSIARELGFPATCFVSDVTNNAITARFHSSEREYPMCGHGTICLMSYLLDSKLLELDQEKELIIELILPTTSARVEMLVQTGARPLIMLDINSPDFRDNQIDSSDLVKLFNLNERGFETSLPIETAVGDFTHLIVPIKSLRDIQSIQPDFSAITAYCRENGIETIACFSTETEQTEFDFHVRDFCPAVGVPESAAAGTTNAALAAYYFRHGIISGKGTRKIKMKTEQGMEINRPSSIHTHIEHEGKNITLLKVGGMARKVLEGGAGTPFS